MMKAAIFAAALVALACAAPASIKLEHQWSFEDFKLVFNKTYASAEEHAVRSSVFAKNLDFIREHNSDTTKTYKVR